MRPMKKLIRDLTMLSQLGISLVVPPLVCTWLGSVLQRRYALGTWVVIVALVIGLMTAASTAYSFYRRFAAKEKKDDEAPPPTSFNSHD